MWTMLDDIQDKWDGPYDYTHVGVQVFDFITNEEIWSELLQLMENI